jgi:type IV secretion system protein VirB5
MILLNPRVLVLWSLMLFACVPRAHAQWAVVDVGAIAQLIQQVATMEEQLSTAKNQLTQARQQFDAMTGGRGMEGLLGGINRNYLPSDWAALESALRGAAGASGALSDSVRNIVEANAVLTPAQVAALPPAERAELQSVRQSTALLQAMTREALATTSQRFASVQSLISAISGASDQKAILDLQARIGAEQGMLQNEQTKLQTLYQALQAERWAGEQRRREQAIADIGAYRDLPALGL